MIEVMSTQPPEPRDALAAFQAWRALGISRPAGLDWLRPYASRRGAGAGEPDPPPFSATMAPLRRSRRAIKEARLETNSRAALAHILGLIGQGRDAEAEAWLTRLADALDRAGDDAGEAGEAVDAVLGAINADRLIRHRPGSA